MSSKFIIKRVKEGQQFFLADACAEGRAAWTFQPKRALQFDHITGRTASAIVDIISKRFGCEVWAEDII